MTYIYKSTYWPTKSLKHDKQKILSIDFIFADSPWTLLLTYLITIWTVPEVQMTESGTASTASACLSSRAPCPPSSALSASWSLPHTFSSLSSRWFCWSSLSASSTASSFCPSSSAFLDRGRVLTPRPHPQPLTSLTGRVSRLSQSQTPSRAARKTAPVWTTSPARSCGSQGRAPRWARTRGPAPPRPHTSCPCPPRPPPRRTGAGRVGAEVVSLRYTRCITTTATCPRRTAATRGGRPTGACLTPGARVMVTTGYTDTWTGSLEEPRLPPPLPLSSIRPTATPRTRDTRSQPQDIRAKRGIVKVKVTVKIRRSQDIRGVNSRISS